MHTKRNWYVVRAVVAGLLLPTVAFAEHGPLPLDPDDLHIFPSSGAAACNHTAGGGGGATLRFYGRIVSRRPMVLGEDVAPGLIEGVDTIRVQVWDADPGDDRRLWQGFTDQNGCFDSGVIPNLGEQEPDIYLRVVANSPAVQINDFDIGTFAWSSGFANSALEFPDFTGDEINFGAARPSIPLLPDFAWAIMQMHNTITRAQRWLRESSGLAIDLPKVLIREPHYAVSFYDIVEDDIVHAGVSLEAFADERIYLHHYAHFLQDQFGSVLPDDCADQSGCTRVSPWCAALSPAKAWQEGFGDWFADIILERLGEIYTNDDGSPWQPAGGEVAPFEHVEVCPGSGFPAQLELASGMFTAFLVDMTDGHLDPEWFFAQDDEKALVADNYSDCSRTGWFEILDVTTQATLPLTPDQFVADYARLYPLQRPALYSTAFNITPAYLATAVFPDDQAPGKVPAAGSRQMGSSPCVPLVVDPPPDDGTGACAYSWEWTMNPAGASPDLTADVLGSCTLPGPVLTPGDWWVSLRARDCAGHWSLQFATFGPFEIRDCNGNGVVDACETSCDENLLRTAYDCDIPLTLCDAAPCVPNDCNGNLTPDDCDIAEGISQDCNEDSIPDDCQMDTVQQWIGGDGIWSEPENWSPIADGSSRVPTADTDVCIDDPQDRVTIFSHAAKSKSVRCAGEILLDGLVNNVSFPSSIEMTERSFIAGTLTIDGPQVVVNAGDLEVGTVSMLAGGILRGKVKVTDTLEIGADTVTFGRAVLTGAPLVTGDVVIGSTATATVNARIFFEVGDERVYVEAGGEFNFHGDGPIITSSFGLIEIDGTFTRASGDGTATIFCETINRGRIDVATGDLAFRNPLNNAGVIAGQTGTTISLVGGTNFAESSVLEAGTLAFTPEGPSAPVVIRGTLDLKDGIVAGGPSVTIDASTNVISYGDRLHVTLGVLRLQAVVGAELVFDDITLVQGQIRFESGDPVRTNTLLTSATIRDASLITVVNGFTWNAAGTIFNSTLVTEGTTQFGPGGSVRALLNSEWTNQGVILLDKGLTMQGADARLINAEGATIDIANPGGNVTLIDDQTALPGTENYSIENDGLITKSTNNVDTVIGPSIWNRGDLVADVGPITLGGFLRQTEGETWLKGGDIILASPFGVFRLEGGILRGIHTFVGTIENTGGTVLPGASAGRLSITGNYEQREDGACEIEIGGLVAVTEHDQLAVTGDVDFGGRLVLKFVNGFAPKAGQTFDFLTVGGTLTEQLDPVEIQNLGPGFQFELTDTGAGLTLTALTDGFAVLPGDCDGDDDVDLADYLKLTSCLTGPGGVFGLGCSCSDLDDDGDVDLADLVALQARFTGSQ